AALDVGLGRLQFFQYDRTRIALIESIEALGLLARQLEIDVGRLQIKAGLLDVLFAGPGLEAIPTLAGHLPGQSGRFFFLRPWAIAGLITVGLRLAQPGLPLLDLGI